MQYIENNSTHIIGQLPKEPFPKNGNIEFRNMSLIYVRGEPPVLKNLNFKVEAGEKVQST